MRTITAEQYKKATGDEPQNDDLERSNCELAETVGHDDCGWDDTNNLPRFMVPWRERGALRRASK